MADLIVDNVIESEIAKHYTGGYRRALLGNGFEAEDFFPHMGEGGYWLFFTAAPLRSASGEIVGALKPSRTSLASARLKTPCGPANNIIASSV